MGSHHQGEDKIKIRMDRLEKLTEDLTNNQKALYKKVGTLFEFTKRVMHSAATIFYFLHVNREEKEARKESDTTRSLYSFLADDLLKIQLEKLVKEEKKEMAKEDRGDKEKR